MKLKTAIAATALFLAISPAWAGEMRGVPAAVVELFTSQGCSSCPPADKVLADLDKSGEVVALAYHVDYWDYIGWKDTFGSAENSDFQRAYSHAQGKGRIYTPQMMVNGTEDVVGSHINDVKQALSRAKLELNVELSASEGMLAVSIGPVVGLPEAAVWLVTFKSGVDVAVARGENAGRSLHYAQIVTGRRVLGMWEPSSGAHIKLPIADMLGNGSDGAAIIVQEDRKGLPGRILGAASFRS